MTDIKFDSYYRYDDLTALLQEMVAQYPTFIRVESIGKSYEGRDIWLAAVTNFETGPDTDKPGFWVDGNIHATEVSPTTACLLHIHTLLTQYGSDADVTRVMDTRVFYVCPRINPDGAEWALADNPKFVRSSTRPWPFDEEPVDGLYTEDIDGDGRILTMRMVDPLGGWKVSDDDPRLMVRRDPTEFGGTYYRLLPEGRMINYDGYEIKVKPNREGLDTNRNFPHAWRPEGEQVGAGPYPTSEPEIRAVVDFITKHRNITGAVTFHTFGGLLLRPYGDQPDESMPAEDLWNFKKIGEKGTALVGYPNISVYHDFRYHPKQIITGVFDDWLYEHLGLYAWTVELWAPVRQAGIEKYSYIDWWREHPLEDDLKLMKWNDEQLDGEGYIDWYYFEHPQLGRVELGGWNTMYTWRNPPFKFLENEIKSFSAWLTWHLLISPELEISDAHVDAIGDNMFRIRVVVDNTGWLPTNISKKAMEKKAVRGVVCDVTLPEGAVLLSGKLREDCGQLAGRERIPAGYLYTVTGSTDERLKLEWVVLAPLGGTAIITFSHERAGIVRAAVPLE